MITFNRLLQRLNAPAPTKEPETKPAEPDTKPQTEPTPAPAKPAAPPSPGVPQPPNQEPSKCPAVKPGTEIEPCFAGDTFVRRQP